MNTQTVLQVFGLAIAGLLSILGAKYGSKRIGLKESIDLEKLLFVGIVLSTALASIGKYIEFKQIEQDKCVTEKKEKVAAEQIAQLSHNVKRLEKPLEIKAVQSQYEIDIENEYLNDYASTFKVSVEKLTSRYKESNIFGMPIPEDNSVVVGRNNIPQQILFRGKTNLLPKDDMGRWMIGNCIWKIKIFKSARAPDSALKSPDLQFGHNTTIYSPANDESIHGSIVYDFNLKTFIIKTDETAPHLEKNTGVINSLVDLQGASIYIEPFGGWSNNTTRINYLRLMLPNGQKLTLTEDMFQSVQKGDDLYLFHHFEKDLEVFNSKYLS